MTKSIRKNSKSIIKNKIVKNLKQNNAFLNKLKKIKTRRKIMFVCIQKNEVSRTFLQEEINEHGALNDKHVNFPVYELQFQFIAPLNRKEAIPSTLFAQFQLTTTNKAQADMFSVGETYPLSVVNPR